MLLFRLPGPGGLLGRLLPGDPGDRLLLSRLPGPGDLLDRLLPGDRFLLLDPGDLLLPEDRLLLFRLPGPGDLLGPLLPEDRLLLFHPMVRDILESPAVRGVLAVP